MKRKMLFPVAAIPALGVLFISIALSSCSKDDKYDYDVPYGVFRVTGTVLYDGQPLSGASVEMMKTDDAGNAIYVEIFDDERSRKTTTAADGTFETEVRALLLKSYTFPIKIASDYVPDMLFTAVFEDYALVEKKEDDSYYKDDNYSGSVFCPMGDLSLDTPDTPDDPEGEESDR